MRIALLLCCALVLAGGPGVARADPLQSTSPEPVLGDPSPRDSHDFAPALANGGTADVSHALGAAPMAAPAGCNAGNPCAVPSPPQVHVEAPRPSHPG